MSSTQQKKAPRKPKQKRSLFTFEQILQGAAQVFEQHGYAKGTTNRIAERAGVSVGTLYQYFPNKDAILTELSIRHMAKAKDEVRRMLALQPADASGLEPFLEELFRSLLAMHTYAPRLHQVLFDEAPWPQHLRKSMRETIDIMTKAVALSLSKIEGLRLVEPITSAWMLVQLSESLTHQYVVHHPEEISEESFIKESVRLMTAYLRS